MPLLWTPEKGSWVNVTVIMQTIPVRSFLLGAICWVNRAIHEAQGMRQDMPVRLQHHKSIITMRKKRVRARAEPIRRYDTTRVRLEKDQSESCKTFNRNQLLQTTKKPQSQAEKEKGRRDRTEENQLNKRKTKRNQQKKKLTNAQVQYSSRVRGGLIKNGKKFEVYYKVVNLSIYKSL